MATWGPQIGQTDPGAAVVGNVEATRSENSPGVSELMVDKWG